MSEQQRERARKPAHEGASLLDEDRLLTAKETAKFLGVPIQALYGQAREGIVPCVRIGRLVKFHPAALREWVANGGKAFAGGWQREPK